MKNKDDLVFVEDILSAISKIKDYCHGATRESFLENAMMVDAVVRNLEIIGEASAKLSPSFKEKHHDIPWRKIVGMRNRVVHAYDSVDPDIVWDAVQSDLPEFEKKLKT